MIIRLLGTNGAGKTTVARAVMSDYPHWAKLHEQGRRKPIGYELTAAGRPHLVVLGHYEIKNGGADTIGDIATVYRLVGLHSETADVLFEGMDMHDGALQTLRLHRAGRRVVVLRLTTSVEDCVAGIRERGHNIGLPRVIRTHNKCERTAALLLNGGVQVEHLDRDGALARVRELLEHRK